MIEQKHAMQLIGKWGYTPSELESILDKMHKRAMKVGEPIGVAAYASLLTLCRFAMTGNPEKSIEYNVNDMPEELRLIAESVMKDMIKDDSEFSDGVVTGIYQVCLHCNNLHEAECAIRISVLQMTSEISSRAIAQAGSDVASNILDLLVAADRVTMENGTTTREIRACAKSLNRFCEQMAEIAQNAKNIKNSSAKVVQVLKENLDQAITFSQQDILSVLDNTPDVWMDYSIGFGKLMTTLLLAMSVGIISYDDYESMRLLLKNQKIDPIDVKFGRN